MKKYIIPISLLFFCIQGLSQVPETMSFQGILTDNNGDPVAETAFTLEFEMYDALTAGTKVWGPETHSVTPVGGVYTVILGSNGEPLTASVNFGSQYYLQLKVNGELITPRFQLTTSPYAFTAREVMGTDNVFPVTGNVGIGTATPSTKLDVSGTITATSFAGGGATLTGLDATNINTGTLADARLESTVDLSSLNVSGSVGIGNTSPATALDVSGTITSTGLTVNGDVTATTFTGDGSALTNLPPTSPIWTGSGDISYSGGNVGIGTASPSTTLDVAGTVNATSFTGDGSGLTNLASSPWTLSAPDVYYDLGKVGIGTSTPTAELEVNVSTPGDGTSVRVENPSASGYSAVTLRNDNRSFALAIGGSTAAIGANNFYILDGQSGTARMTLNSTGDVGIGTSSPSTKLEVNGAITATSYSGAGGSLTGLNASNLSSGTVNNLRLDTDLQDLADGSLSGNLVGTGLSGTNITTGTVADARLESIVDVTRLNTTGGLHVGGTSDPGVDNLLVDGTVTATSFSGALTASNLTGTIADARLETTVDVTRLNTTGGLHVGGTSDPGTDNMIVDGMVGIGAAPSYPLDIESSSERALNVTQSYGGALDKYGVISFVDAAGTGKKYGLWSQVNNNSATEDSYAAYVATLGTSPNKYGIYTVGEDRNYFGSAVGIGVDPPVSMLDVNGTVTATQFSGSGAGLTNLPSIYGSSLELQGAGSSMTLDATSGNPLLTYQENGTSQYQLSYLPASNYFSIAETGVGEHLIIADGGYTTISGTNSSSEATFNVISDDNFGFVSSIEADYAGIAGLLVFKQQDANIGLITATSGVVSYGTFTGSHYAKSDRQFEPGQVAVLKGDYSYLEGMDYGEPIYHVTVSNRANDPQVLGTYFSENPVDDGIQLISAVGNGQVWIIDNGVNLKAGDYLITSDIPGHAMKDKGEFELAYVFARVAEDVNWSEVSETIHGVKRKNISIFYETFTRNHKADMLEKELDDLKREVQALKDLLTQSN